MVAILVHRVFVVLLAALLLAPAASATQLLFGGLNWHMVDQNYGDRAVGPAHGGYNGLAETGGWTPHVVVDYVPDGSGWLAHWDFNYGDLFDVAYWDFGGPGNFTIRFTADPGYLVTLHSFELAGWPKTGFPLEYVRVYNGNGVLLWQDTGVVAPGEGSVLVQPGAPWGVTDQVLNLELGVMWLWDNRDSVGIDNIVFTESLQASAPVPELGTLVLAASGAALVAVAAVLRRRRAA